MRCPRTASASSCDEAVVEPLVVAVVEALLLERPLEVPVRLGRRRRSPGWRLLTARDHARPVVVGRPRPGALAPRALEDVVHHQHRHVAAHAVALVGDRAAASRPRRRAGRARTRSAARRPARPGSTGRGRSRATRSPTRTNEAGSRSRSSSLAADEVLGMRLRPRVVGRDVVRHEVEDQPDARARASAVARRGEARPARRGARRPRSRGCSTASRPRPSVAKSGSARAEALDAAPSFCERDRDPGRAALPDAHQPDGVEPERRDRVPLASPARRRGRSALPSRRLSSSSQTQVLIS